MQDFCVAMELCNLKHIDEDIAKEKVVEKYRKHLVGVKDHKAVTDSGGLYETI